MSGEIVHGRTVSGDLTLECDVVIVGSGAGGAVMAYTLAKAGQNVVVLEEGGHVRPEEHARMRPSESLRHVWRESGMTMALGLRNSPMINVMMGRCVGGSSTLTGGVCFRIPQAVLDEWQNDLGLEEMTAEHLAPFYAEVDERCHIKEVPVDHQSRSTQLFAAGAKTRGFVVEPMRRNTKGCVGWSKCNFGCPETAKMSVDISYLPDAIASGARLYSDCLVERVTADGGKATGVIGRVLNGPGTKKGGKLTVKARRVVLSAGAVHTPLILMKSGVAKRSGQVGRNLTLHPAFRIMARFDEVVDGSVGALQSAFSSKYEPDGVQLNSVFVPGGILAATQPGVGTRFMERARGAKHLAMFGANLHDEGGGTVTKTWSREPLIRYRMAAKDRAAMGKALRIAGETFFAAGAREVFLPILGYDGLDPDAFRALDIDKIPATKLECTSQHPLGTCRMGTDAATSVVNPDGRVWDVEDLYISDGSTVPTSLGVNPQLTIMTLSTRVAKKLERLPLR